MATAALISLAPTFNITTGLRAFNARSAAARKRLGFRIVSAKTAMTRVAASSTR